MDESRRSSEVVLGRKASRYFSTMGRFMTANGRWMLRMKGPRDMSYMPNGRIRAVNTKEGRVLWRWKVERVARWAPADFMFLLVFIVEVDRGRYAHLSTGKFQGCTEMGLGVVDEPFGGVVTVFWSPREGMFGC